MFCGVPGLWQCGRVGTLCFTIAHPTILGNARTGQSVGRDAPDLRVPIRMTGSSMRVCTGPHFRDRRHTRTL